MVAATKADEIEIEPQTNVGTVPQKKTISTNRNPPQGHKVLTPEGIDPVVIPQRVTEAVATAEVQKLTRQNLMSSPENASDVA
jgi:hypothetical protein